MHIHVWCGGICIFMKALVQLFSHSVIKREIGVSGLNLLSIAKEAPQERKLEVAVVHRSVTHSRTTLWNPRTAVPHAPESFTISWSLLRLTSIELVMPDNHLMLCSPLLFLPSIFPSIRIFSSESTSCIWWPKYWSFSFSISPSNAYSRLISIWIDWLDLLAVQGTLKSLLQHYSSKASILQHSAFVYCQALTFIHDYWLNHSFDRPLLIK